MKTALLIADVVWYLGTAAIKHTRKRAPGDEDHWFPRNPEAWGLFDAQCRWCLRVLLTRPARGCDANIISRDVLDDFRAQQRRARAAGLRIVAVDAHGRVRAFGGRS